MMLPDGLRAINIGPPSVHSLCLPARAGIIARHLMAWPVGWCLE